MDISSLSNQEYVTLVGHYNQIGDKTLEKQLIARNYTPEAIEKIKTKIQSTPVKTVRSLNVEFKTNDELTFSEFGYCYTLFRMYSDHGTLPFNGCLTDQPAKIIEIFEVFEQLKCETEQKQMKEMQKKHG